MTPTKRRVGHPPITGGPMRATSLYIPVELYARLRAEGNGNMAAGVRALVAERDALDKALRLACADLLAKDTAIDATITAADLADAPANLADVYVTFVMTQTEG